MQARTLHKHPDLEETVYKQDARQNKQLLMLNGVCETFGCTYVDNFYINDPTFLFTIDLNVSDWEEQS